jgi:hypothetical protein
MHISFILLWGGRIFSALYMLLESVTKCFNLKCYQPYCLLLLLLSLNCAAVSLAEQARGSIMQMQQCGNSNTT